MAEENKSGPAEAVKGVVEDVKGKAKEAVGAVAGRDDLTREGQAQQDKAEAQRDAAKKEAEAEAARGGAERPRSARSPTSSLMGKMGPVHENGPGPSTFSSAPT